MQMYVFWTGFVVSILMATLGAYLSRRLRLDYSLMLGLCFVNYFMTGYTAAQFFTTNASMVFAATLAVVDLTLGADLSRRIGYFTRLSEKKRKGPARVAAHAFVVMVAGMAGLYGALAAHPF